MLVSNGFYQRLIIGSSGERFRVFPSVCPAASSKLTSSFPLKRNAVYLVVIGWLYVVMMMSVAEASNTTGTVLGAIVTFFLYGLLPVALVVYLMRTPQRRKEIKAREAVENQARRAAMTETATPSGSAQPDAGCHAPGAAETEGVAAVRKET
jgi:hypothetical protein